MNDAISRKELMKALRDLCDETDCNIAIMPDVMEIVRDAPAAGVEPVRHGRWVDGRCSLCSVPAVTMRQIDGVEIRVETPRCPNCGAKMDGTNVDGRANS